MNFDKGFQHGRFLISWIIIEDFFGIAIRIGKEKVLNQTIYHITTTIGCGQLCIGFVGKEKNDD